MYIIQLISKYLNIQILKPNVMDDYLVLHRINIKRNPNIESPLLFQVTYYTNLLGILLLTK